MLEPIAIKEVIINGERHLVKVYPPTEEIHDEVVWRHPKAGSHHALMRQVAALDGRITSINDVADEDLDAEPL